MDHNIKKDSIMDHNIKKDNINELKIVPPRTPPRIFSILKIDFSNVGPPAPPLESLLGLALHIHPSIHVCMYVCMYVNGW